MNASPRALILLISAACSFHASAAIRYVNAAADTGGTGLAWKQAYKHLQDALAAAQPGDQIWVAKGTYFPDLGTGMVNNDRNATFAMKTGVAIYGGFDGENESFNSRNPAVNVVTLSGEIANTPANDNDNSYHVVTANGVGITATLEGVTITGGRANAGTYPDASGGAIMCLAGSPQISKCIISGNSAENLGGAVHIDGLASIGILIQFTDCTFTGNSATERAGGAVFAARATTDFVDCSFTSNTCAGDGGALYFQESSNDVRQCTFTSNISGRQGGALRIEKSEVFIIGGAFSLNEATNKGGAIHVDLSTYSITNTPFSGNKAQEGGAISNTGSKPTITGSNFTGNTATLSSGGAIRATPLSSTRSDLVLSTCVFAGNSAVSGGALSLEAAPANPASSTITGCTFNTNHANSAGGAILTSYHSPTISGGTFTTNDAGDRGGAISLSQAASCPISNTRFHDNDSPSGGAIQLSASNMDLTGCEFTENTASIAGGAISLDSSGANAAACVFKHNTGGYGGAMALGTAAVTPSVWTNCAFSGNSADIDGGAIIASNASPVFRGCLISGNKAGSRAGALALNSSTSVLINCTVTGNSALLGANVQINNGTSSVTNTIIHNNLNSSSGSTTSKNASMTFENGAAVTFSHSLVANFTKSELDAGDSPDTNLEPQNPLFVTLLDPATAPAIGGNFALATGSPAINQGDNTAVSFAVDLLGNVRVVGPIVDLGAYENQGLNPFVGDADGDGVSGGVEQAIGTNPGFSDAANARHLRILPGRSITFGHDPSTAATIALELRRSTDLIHYNVVVASSVTGFPAAGSGGIITINDPSAPAGKAFYRLQATPR